jgi:hypothetical protein
MRTSRNRQHASETPAKSAAVKAPCIAPIIAERCC